MLKFIGFTELLVILGLALLIFGPSQLPDLAKSLGCSLKKFRGTMDEVENLDKKFKDSIDITKK